MRLISFFLAALTLFSSALAVDIQKSVIVSYPEGTPDSVLDQAKDAIRQAGGQITHEYTLIRYVETAHAGVFVARQTADHFQGLCRQVRREGVGDSHGMGLQVQRPHRGGPSRIGSVDAPRAGETKYDGMA